MIILILLVGLIVVGGWYYVMGKSKSLAETRTSSDYLNQQQNALSTLEIEYQKALPDKDIIFDSLPNGKNISSFIADLDNVASNHQLSVTTINVGSQAPTAGTPTTTDPNLSQMTVSGAYYVLPIQVIYHGSCANFTQAVGDLYNLRRETNITEIDISKSSADGSDQTDLVDATVDLNVFVKPWNQR